MDCVSSWSYWAYRPCFLWDVLKRVLRPSTPYQHPRQHPKHAEWYNIHTPSGPSTNSYPAEPHVVPHARPCNRMHEHHAWQTSVTATPVALLQAADFLRDATTMAEVTEGLAAAVMGDDSDDASNGAAPSAIQCARAAWVRSAAPCGGGGTDAPHCVAPQHACCQCVFCGHRRQRDAARIVLAVTSAAPTTESCVSLLRCLDNHPLLRAHSSLPAPNAARCGRIHIVRLSSG